MKGLRIIPMFLILILLSYLGMLFVEANHDAVLIQFGDYKTPPNALGLVVLTSVLIGMLIAGLLCSIEILSLYMQNKALRRKLNALRPAAPPRMDRPLDQVGRPDEPSDATNPKIEPERTGKFSF